jgi:hypothetical protein
MSSSLRNVPGKPPWPTADIQHFELGPQVFVEDVPVYGILDPPLEAGLKPIPLSLAVEVEKISQSIGIVAHNQSPLLRRSRPF